MIDRTNAPEVRVSRFSRDRWSGEKVFERGRIEEAQRELLKHAIGHPRVVGALKFDVKERGVVRFGEQVREAAGHFRPFGVMPPGHFHSGQARGKNASWKNLSELRILEEFFLNRDP